MRKKSISILISFIIICFCGAQSQKSGASSKIRIISSVFPLMEFAKAVSGDRGEVSLFIPPGVEIHTWNPRPSDIIKLSSADFFIYLGADLEPWLDDVLRSVRNPELEILEASQGLSLINEDPAHKQHLHEGETVDEDAAIDSHVWLDFIQDQLIIDKIEALLSRFEPENSHLFKKNAAIYKERLGRLDERYQKALKDCSQRTLILGGHAAFGYLARRYGFHQISLYGLNPDSKPTPRQMIEIVELAKKNSIKAIYFEEYIGNELAEVLAKEVGAETLILNPGANLTRDEFRAGKTFFDLMEKNLENLRYGLSCN